jgi:hypothetical protein
VLEIEQYLSELSEALRVRGATRRRILAECREHLVDAAAERGPTEAIGSFGSARELAAAFDTGIAVGRGVRSTWIAIVGVLAIGASTLVLINGADENAHAVTLWAVVFFAAAQLAGTAAVLALVQALSLRRRSMTTAEIALLARRNLTALTAAGVTLFAAGAAVPGTASALALLAGPAIAVVGVGAVLRAYRHTRLLDGARARAVRSPLVDLSPRADDPLASFSDAQLLLPVATLAAIAAFLRDLAEHATAGQALVTAGVEALLVAACFVALGRRLGVRPLS